MSESDLPAGAAPGKLLSPEARRALEEAAARRTSSEPQTDLSQTDSPQADEQGGPRGPEPTRYGDWERKGLAVDF